MRTLLSELIRVTQRLKKAGWDGHVTEDKPMAAAKKQYPTIKWLMEDADVGDNQGALYGVLPHHKDFVVALYEIRSEKGQKWMYFKVLEGKMGPTQRPPTEFWNKAQVKDNLDKDYIEKEKSK